MALLSCAKGSPDRHFRHKSLVINAISGPTLKNYSGTRETDFAGHCFATSGSFGTTPIDSVSGGSMQNLFAYGTLMCDDIMTEVSGRRFSCVPAILRGYRRMRVKREHYPALVAATGSHVEGVLYLDVSQPAWARLDRFEGEAYTREPVQVELPDGSEIAAATYVVHGDFTTCLDETEWDLATFHRDGKESFRASYKGYRALN